MSRLLVGPGASRGPWAKGLSPAKRLMLVSEPGAFGRFGPALLKGLRRAGWAVSTHLLPQGEGAKDWKRVERLLSALAEAGVGRDGALAALGGGAVTDAAGFAASVYLRGIPWACLPTTLLGQLDSGLGGKTGVNLAQGKNLAGAFHQPAVVVCDTTFLASLPLRERLSGLAEAVKVALVFEPAFYDFLTRRWGLLLEGDPRATEAVVRRTGAWKLKIVAQDERETKGRRELLNFGHTLGHALEKEAGYGALRHGEAVFWGMRAALRLSVLRAGFSKARAAELECFLASAPVIVPGSVSPFKLAAACLRDKKARGGKARFVLLRRPGRPVVKTISQADLLKVARGLLEQS